MRLFEVEGNVGDDFLTAMRSEIRPGSTLSLSYRAISQILRNLGYGGVSNETAFTRMLDASPKIRNIIKGDYSGKNAVTFGYPDSDDLNDGDSDETPETPELPPVTGNSPTVQSAARSANPYM